MILDTASTVEAIQLLFALVGVCLAVPAVGVLQVTRRDWREYRGIEALVGEQIARRSATSRS